MYIAKLFQEDEEVEFFDLNATTREEAIEELKRKVIGEFDEVEEDFIYGYYNEQKLDKVILREIKDEEEMPLSDWYNEAKLKIVKLKKITDELEERKLLAKLKDKYE